MAGLAPREKVCACKGIRTCLLCEGSKPDLSSKRDDLEQNSWYFCSECGDKAYKELTNHKLHADVQTHNYIHIQGVLVVTDFVTSDEEITLVDNIDKIPWVESQSGRRKHDFGPKVNFKKKKVKQEAFKGFPQYSRFLIDKLSEVEQLRDFQAVEMCNLDYQPNKGASIDPHFDDFWLWGERLVTVNLLSETCYTLTRHETADLIIVALPRHSLIVLYGEARYKWMHSIARHHIAKRRIGITIRELTPQFLEGGELESVGRDLLAKAQLHCDVES